MAIFSRGPRKPDRRVIPAGELQRLPDIGRVTFREGQYTDVSGFYLESFVGAASPAPGSPEFGRFLDQFLGELFDAAVQNSDGWALAGALRVATDFIGPDGMRATRFVELVDLALPFMASVGVERGFIPRFLLGRWDDLQ